MKPEEFRKATAEKRKKEFYETVKDTYCNGNGDNKVLKEYEKIRDLLKGKELFEIDDAEKIRGIWKKMKDLDWNKSASNGAPRAAVGKYYELLTGAQLSNQGNRRNNNLTPPPVTGLSYNKILYGAPGTGKSHKVKTEIEVNKENLAAAYRTTFHPDTDYTTFVGCYKPFKPQGGSLDYKFVPQAFLKAYVAAWKEIIEAEKATSEEGKRDPKLVYLVIEEINRGNCAQAFGDIFQLLDRDEEGFSKYHITPDEDICNYLKDKLGENYARYKELIQDRAGIKDEEQVVKEEVENTESTDNIWTEDDNDGLMLLPRNLIIRATMNTSDQSLFPMDSAFKRRWDWEYVPINYKNNTAKKIVINFGNDKAKWVEVLKAINKKIVEQTHSNKKQMGEFFAGTADITFDTFRDKVLFYLFTDALKDRKGFAEEFGNDKIQFFEDFFDKDDGGKNLIIEWIKRLKVETVKVQEGKNEVNSTPTNDEDNANDDNKQSGDQEETPNGEAAEGGAEGDVVEQITASQD